MNKSNTDWIDGGYAFHGSNELIGLLLANEKEKRLTIGSAFKKGKTKEER
jgi:hypothetical protein